MSRSEPLRRGSSIDEHDPRDHLAPFDMFRVLLCLSVVAYHVVEESAAMYSKRGAPWERSALIGLIYGCAPPAVDAFFTYSGFFCARSCARIASDPTLDARGRLRSYGARIVTRWWKFAKIHAVLIVVAFLLGDGRYFPDGGVDGWRVLATFGWKNYHRGWYGWFDTVSVPLWSNFVDLHATCLIALVFAVSGGLDATGWLAVAVAAAACRWAIILGDPRCLDESCLDLTVLSTLLTLPGDDGSPGRWLGAPPFSRGPPGHCGGCPLDAAAWVDNWASSLYTPTHARLAPFFVGAALAAALEAVPPTATWSDRGPWTARGPARDRLDYLRRTGRRDPPNPRKILGRILVLGLAFVWAAESHAIAPPLLRGRALAALGPIAADALSGLFTGLCWSVIVFSVVAPEYHWLRCTTLAAVAAAPAWRHPAAKTLGVYCLHWPWLMLALRHVKPLPASDASAFLEIFVPTLAGAVASAVAYDAILA
mmetsp:Transcript_990/g.2687  ORF Transcript_990/g.2687 Transcript_990/m.2687 type:complete len:481 (-) Transcript_990:262-1704(-)